MSAEIDPSLLRELDGLSGELLRPGDRDYEAARRVHNGLIDKRPGLIVRCRAIGDIVASVECARAHGFELSIRGGGHNVAGRAVTEGGLMIDLALMRDVEVDSSRRTARVEGGATWGDVDRATQANRLAVTGGMISTTGVAGLTLGGGLGWLMGKHGLTVDNLVSAEVVTADGRVVTASESENPDLFWGLRGGGGNFGVVASFEYRLHPVGPKVTGLRAAYPLSSARTMLRHYRDLTTGDHDDMTVNAGLLHAPDGSGAKLAGLIGCHLGSSETAEHELRHLAEVADPVLLEIGPVEYAALNSVLDEAYPRGARDYWKSSFLRALSDEAIETTIEQFLECPSPMSAFVIENLHGALTRVAPDATAFAHRAPGYNLLITSEWRDPGADEENLAWTRSAFAALEPFAARRRYVNYLADDEDGEDPVREAYGANYERLVDLKSRYDPQNLFRLNQNIRPRPAATSLSA